MNTDTTGALRALRPALEAMPDPSGHAQVTALEDELAAAFGAAHAIAVSSGTAALHTALAALGIGADDEVLLPAATVVMTVAAVTATGARPVFVDARPPSVSTVAGMDPADLTAKITPRTRAIIAVHLAGRCDNLADVATVADRAGLPLIEDACQAQGSVYHARAAGLHGRIGCFSMKDGKILSSGEGGYLLTDDPGLAAHAAAYRTHGQTPAPGAPAGSRLGHNFRLAEPLAALARHQLAAFPDLLRRRRQQAAFLTDTVDAPGLVPIPPTDGEQPNDHSPLWRLTFVDPRDFCDHLATHGVPNSVGTYGLRSADTHPACQSLDPAPCPRATRALDTLLAVTCTSRDTDPRLAEMAATINAAAPRWDASS